MRKPMLAGNWKMNKTRDEALQFILQVNENVPAVELVDTVVCAPAIILRDLVKRQGEFLRIGAQNMHEKDSGAYTGEISAVMLQSTAVEYVILGHSERRQYFNETDSAVNAKTIQALKHGLKPIVCVGETIEEKEAGNTNAVLVTQTVGALTGVDMSNPENVIIAYEPVWAIGTGKSASSQDANDGCAFIRSVLAKMFGAEVAEKVRILYGGSVKPATVNELFAESDIDGFLVGGAALKADDFLTLCHACVRK
jgi:triosephosphate isomerase